MRALDHAQSCPFCRAELSPIAIYRLNDAIDTLLNLTHPEAVRARRAEAQAAEELPRDFVPIFVCMTVCRSCEWI